MWGGQDEFAMDIYEETVRYHVLCHHELCEDAATANDPEGFSPGLNREQLNKVTTASRCWTLRPPCPGP